MQIEPHRGAYIWSRDQLCLLLEHPSVEVQSWAACRVLDLYPEAKDEILLKLPSVSSVAASRLLDSLKELPLTESDVSPLLDFLQGEHKPVNWTITAVLLLRCGYEFSQTELGGLSVQGATKDMALTKSGFDFLLKLMLEEGEKTEEVYHGLAYGCGADGIYELLSETKDRKRKNKILDFLKKQWNCRLPDVLRTGDIETALRVMEDSLAENRLLLDKSDGDGVALMELKAVSERCSLLAEATKECSPFISSDREVLLLLGCSLSLLRDTACYKALVAGGRNVGELWKALTMRPWISTEADKGIVELLRSRDPEEVLSSLRAALGVKGWVYGDYAFGCLDNAAVPGRYQLLLEALEGKWDFAISEDAERVLRRIGPGAVTAAIEHWHRQQPRASDLLWLERYPNRAVVQFLLDNFDTYITAPDSGIFVELLGEVGSRDFLEPLLNEWREGEAAIGETIRLIAELNNVQDERLTPVIKDTENKHSGTLSLEDDNADSVIPIPLRCTTCGRSYHYTLERLYLGNKKKDVVIGEIVQCKGCGAIETYEITTDTWWALCGRLVRSLAISKSEELDEEEGPFKGKLMGVTAGGRKFKTISEAYHFLYREVEREPENADLKKRLGNVLRNGNRSDLALPYYQDALRLDPGDAKTAYLVAAVLLEQRRFREAIVHVEELTHLIRSEEMDDRLRRDLFTALLDQAGIIYEQTGHRIQLWPKNAPAEGSEDAMPLTLEFKPLDPSDTEEFEKAYCLFLHGVWPPGDADNSSEKHGWAVLQRPMKKVGRNDPCPCGSGKKFKKCCGR